MTKFAFNVSSFSIDGFFISICYKNTHTLTGAEERRKEKEREETHTALTAVVLVMTVTVIIHHKISQPSKLSLSIRFMVCKSLNKYKSQLSVDRLNLFT